MQDRAQYESVDLHQQDYGHTGWFTYMRDFVSPTSLWRLARSGMARIDRAPGVPPYSAGMDMRSGGTTSNKDRISAMLHGVDTRHTEYDTRYRYPSGIPSTYLASRPLLGRDGQDSEGAAENRQRPVPRRNNANPTVCGTSDHEDSRRLASGLTTDLSGEDSGRNPGSHPSADRSVLGRQTDPSDRRTSDWRSSTLGSHPNMGVDPSHSSLTGIEWGPARNTNRILMTGLRRPDQRGATAWDANWVRPIIPNRLMMLLSGTDNRRSRLDEYSVRPRVTPSEVQELQCRAREYMRQQLEQLDDWDRHSTLSGFPLSQGMR